MYIKLLDSAKRVLNEEFIGLSDIFTDFTAEGPLDGIIIEDIREDQDRNEEETEEEPIEES